MFGAGRGIRTPEGVCRLIYSQMCLATSLSQLVGISCQLLQSALSTLLQLLAIPSLKIANSGKTLRIAILERLLFKLQWSRRRESNPRPAVYKTAALATELRRQEVPLSEHSPDFSRFPLFFQPIYRSNRLNHKSGLNSE